MKKYFKNIGVCLLLLAFFYGTAYAVGTGEMEGPLTEVDFGSILPVVTENGKITLSVDGLGTLSSSGVVQVEKPPGATVRKAYLAVATRGISGYHLPQDAMLLDGLPVHWDVETISNINSWNYWAEVTALVKPKLDSAAAGRVDFVVTEPYSYNVDGEILVVIFDDPAQTTDNTIVLLFGAQRVAGDTFAIALAEPIDKTDPNLVLDMSLGISYGAQGCASGQYSKVDVNGLRMTSSAGGEDDGTCNNGALLTVGGLDDSNANPANPYGFVNFNPRQDDELYNLIPFVSNGDTAINVYTQNPSNDDNIFFSALFLGSTTAIVGEGIVLAPTFDINYVGDPHTVTATLQDDDGNPLVGRTVTFNVVSGPHAGTSGTAVTDASGQASFTYTGTAVGNDYITASFVNSAGETVTSNEVIKKWESFVPAPEPVLMLGLLMMVAPVAAYVLTRKRE